MASCWEMAIKASLGKLTLSGPLQRFVQEQLEVNGFSLLAVSLEHAGGVAGLPFHHRDPFDRLHRGPGAARGDPARHADPIFPKYGVKRIW